MDKQEKIVSPAIRNTGSLDSVGVVMCVSYDDEQSKSTPYGFCIGEKFINRENGFITSKNRFVDAKEAMKIAIKSGQYPDYEFRKKVCLHAIEEANENKKHNQENIGFDGQLYVTDIEYLENRIKEYDSLLEREELKPEDLY